MRRLRRPPGHTLYWIYVHFPDGYNFDTTTVFSEAEKILGDLQREHENWTEAFIWFGSDDGAFTHLDPAKSKYRKG